MTAHTYIIRADAPTADPERTRIVGYWSDALRVLSEAVRLDGAERVELYTFPDGALVATHDGTGYDFAPAPRDGLCLAAYRRVLDDAPMTCRRAAGHRGFCRADGLDSDAG